MAASFPASARVVQCAAAPRRSAHRLGVLWPAWAYRITAPILQKRGLDLFERAVLGLCQAGVRSPEGIGELLGLDIRLCAHILDRATTAGHLDRHREPTEQGRESLRTGSVIESPEWRVFYVFQDPFTNELWPRTVEQLEDAYVLLSRDDEVLLQLGTAGKDDRLRARRIVPPDGVPPKPSVAQVLGAVSTDHADRRVEQVREFERAQGLEPVAVPEETLLGSRGPGAFGGAASDIHRISFVAEEEPVFLVCFVEANAAGAGSHAEGWVAHDPFGVGHSDLLRTLIDRYAPDDSQIDEDIRQRVEAEVERAGRRLREAEHEARGPLEVRMVHDLGPAIRDHRAAYDLMMGVEIAVARGDRVDAIDHVMLATQKLYEELFRRMAVAYPLPRKTEAEFTKSLRVRRAGLEKAAQVVGFHTLPGLYNRDLGSGAPKPYVKDLVPYCLLAAASSAHPGHPLRRMAQRRPDLLEALELLNPLRNRASHAAPDPTSVQDARWCRRVALEAARELINLPEVEPERKER
ncbi:hypothetical protein [Micromonospora sp. NBRC 101691]|uniref:hypothetical protein n=1 Tax=Micromonospora sp. NBRC 101691 TaxID=3032198 RepID=UPI00249FFDE3|nr:hypothetical protein [Micromonospora sp. NBRC 101691]GLY24434.1 hypothetical protein Misp04_41660 [Micromonospora sp. NBRC 101691]